MLSRTTEYNKAFLSGTVTSIPVDGIMMYLNLACQRKMCCLYGSLRCFHVYHLLTTVLVLTLTEQVYGCGDLHLVFATLFCRR